MQIHVEKSGKIDGMDSKIVINTECIGTREETDETVKNLRKLLDMFMGNVEEPKGSEQWNMILRP